MKLLFKIGTQPLVSHEVAECPAVGDRIQLPYPTGGIYSVVITEIDFHSTIAKSIFRGEWM